MKLTPEQIADNAAAYVAAMNGRPWQYQLPKGGWDDTDPEAAKNGILWYLEKWPCRPAPIPEPPKPWDCVKDLENLGQVIWIRSIGSDESRLVNTINSAGFHFGSIGALWSQTGLLSNLEYSTDRKTWKPCVKEAK